MKTLWIIATIAILGIIITLVSSSKEYFYINDLGQFRIKVKGYVVLICGIGIVGLSVWQGLLVYQSIPKAKLIIYDKGIKYSRLPIADNVHQFEITLVSKNASANIKYLDCLGIFELKDNTTGEFEYEKYITGAQFPKDVPMIKPFLYLNKEEIKMAYFIFKGIVQTEGTSKKTKFIEVYGYDPKDKLTRHKSGLPKETFLKKYNLN